MGRLALDGVDKAQQQLKGLEGYVKQNEKAFKMVGAATAAFGGAIVGALTLAVKSAQEEEVGIQRLSTSLKNVGVSYDMVKDSLEGIISATQRKTGIADSEQRDALGKLLIITGDYNKALNALPVVLDLAAATQMDTSTAATMLGKALEGNTETLGRYGIKIKEGATESEILAEIIARTGGAAEATANPFKILSAEIGDVAEMIGKSLLPILKDLIENKIVPIIDKVKAWIDKNPELAKVLTITAAAVGLVSLGVGGLILLLPILTSAIAIMGTTAGIALGGIPIIIGLITAGAVLLWQNWDKVTNFIEKAWSNIKIFFLEGVESILATLAKFTSWIPGLGDKIQEAHDKIANMVDAEKVTRNLRDVDEALKHSDEILANYTDTTGGLTTALQDNRVELELQQAQLEKQKAAHDSLQESVEATRKQFEYERSEAGKLGITVRDVTFALFDLGYTNEQITETLSGLGKEGTNVNAVMVAFGLDAQQVNDILEKQRIALDKTTEAYNRQGEAALKATRYSAGGFPLPSGTHAVEPGMSPEQKAYAMGWDWETLTPEQYAAVGGYQHGGLITEPTLLTRLGSTRPYGIMAEKSPEYITPSGQKINIFVELDGRIIAKAIGQPLVDEIRVRTGVKI